MTRTLAVVGKGGTGKTTLAALMIKRLVARGEVPILAIDADPSANLNLALGMPLHQTVGQIREETQEQVSGGTFATGISKPDWFRYQILDCLEEGEGDGLLGSVDLLAMGRPEGPGCYCAANHMLRQAIDALGDAYRSVVIDNEAGMEHISRQTTRDVDWLLIVSDPTVRGLDAAQHIVGLIASLGTRIANAGLVVNRVRGELPSALAERVSRVGVPLLGTLPDDPDVGECDALGRPLVSLPEEGAIYRAVAALIDRYWTGDGERQQV